MVFHVEFLNKLLQQNYFLQIWVSIISPVCSLRSYRTMRFLYHELDHYFLFQAPPGLGGGCNSSLGLGDEGSTRVCGTSRSVTTVRIVHATYTLRRAARTAYTGPCRSPRTGEKGRKGREKTAKGPGSQPYWRAGVGAGEPQITVLGQRAS